MTVIIASNERRLELLVRAKMSVTSALGHLRDNPAVVHFRKAKFWLDQAIDDVRHGCEATHQMGNAMAHLNRARADLVAQGLLD